MSKVTRTLLTQIDGEPALLGEYSGKVLLIVNVASQCGFTRQYAGLEGLYQRFKDKGLVVLGFPANDFGNQEPGTNEEIKAFCSSKFNVTFPMFAKSVVTGPDKNPLFAQLIEGVPTTTGDSAKLRKGLEEYAAANGVPPPTTPPEVLWNFEKFLVGRDGEVVARFGTEVDPEDSRITSAVEAELAK